MKILMPMLAFLAIASASLNVQAQNDTTRISQQALLIADSLVKTEHFENWSTYADLVPASVIKYYGGKDGFIEHARIGSMRTLSVLQEDAPQLQLLTLRTEKEQWQCVIRMSRYFHKEDKKFHQVTYFVGQSKDEGETWRLFDASHNSVSNINLLLPDVFGDLPIPQPVIMSEEDELAQQQAAAKTAAKPVGSKPKTARK